MTTRPTVSPAPASPPPPTHRTGSHDTPRPAAPACAQSPAEETICPSCGGAMRLWANYYRCSTCGFKESCCF